VARVFERMLDDEDDGGLFRFYGGIGHKFRRLHRV